MESQLNLFSLKEQKQKAKTIEEKEKSPTPMPQPLQIKYNSLSETKSAAMKCKKCELCKGRTNVVFSDGPENSKIMIIGEGPGENEDLQGLPFVGRAGQFMDKIFGSVKLNRKEHLYICNIVKCRPPNNRAPQEDEAKACSEYLEAQIKYIDPKIVILAGAVAVKGILKMKDAKITKIRGQWIENSKDPLLAGRKIMPILHPSYLLRHEWNKAPDSPKAMMWKDVQEIRRVFDSL
jgi:DNA polymerase